MFLRGFTLGFTLALGGVAVGYALSRAPRVVAKVKEAHNALGAMTGGANWWRTTHFFWNAALVYIDQTARRTLQFDPTRRAYVLSFVLKGKLHQILVAPQRGPANHDDSFARGYASIVAR